MVSNNEAKRRNAQKMHKSTAAWKQKWHYSGQSCTRIAVNMQLVTMEYFNIEMRISSESLFDN